MCNYFYGWYFRCQSSSGSIAVIPAVHLSEKERSCSIQIITQKGSWSKEFPISQFRIDRNKGIMQIGENLFSKKGIRLSFEAAATGSFRNGQKSSSGTEIQKIVSVQGILQFRKWKGTAEHRFRINIFGLSIFCRMGRSCLLRHRFLLPGSILQAVLALYCWEIENIDSLLILAGRFKKSTAENYGSARDSIGCGLVFQKTAGIC